MIQGTITCLMRSRVAVSSTRSAINRACNVHLPHFIFPRQAGTTSTPHLSDLARVSERGISAAVTPVPDDRSIRRPALSLHLRVQQHDPPGAGCTSHSFHVVPFVDVVCRFSPLHPPLNIPSSVCRGVHPCQALCPLELSPAILAHVHSLQDRKWNVNLESGYVFAILQCPCTPYLRVTGKQPKADTVTVTIDIFWTSQRLR